MIPISIEVVNFSDTPVELVLADFILFFSILFLIVKRLTLNTINYYDLKFFYVFIAFTFLISFISSIYYQSLSPVAGQLRFVKSTFVICVAYYLALENKEATEKYIVKLSYIFSLIAFSLILSDLIFNGVFPLGRWGGNLFSFDVYGFPNAAASYYAICSVMLFYSIEREKNPLLKFLLILGLLLVFAICIFSLSRNALFTYLMSTLLSVVFLLKNYRLRLFIIFVFIFFIIMMVPYILLNEGVMYKFNAISGADPLSGRGDVWVFSLNFIGISPLWGFGFYSFNNWGFEIGTLHNMFLDIIYKMGFIGLFMYLTLFLLPIIRYKNLPVLKRMKLKDEVRLYSIMLTLCFFSGSSQESLSYSMNQLLMLYLSGILLGKVEQIKREVN